MKPTDKALDEALDEALSVTQIPEENMREYMRRVLTAAYAAQFQSEDYAGLVKRLRAAHVSNQIEWRAADAIEVLLAKLNNKPKPSEDYAGLVGILRAAHISNQIEWRAADALEALLAKLNNRPKPSEEYADLIRSLRGEPPTNSTLDPLRAADALEALLADRDALKAENDQHKSVYQKYAEAIDRMNGTPCEQVRHHYEVSELRSELALAVSERDALAARLAPVEDEELVEIAVRTHYGKKWDDPENGPGEAMKEVWRNLYRKPIAAVRLHIEAAERERCARIADKQGWCAGSAVVCGPEIAAAIRSGK